MKSEYEIEFEQSCLTLDKEFQLAQKQKGKLNEQRLTHFNNQMKKLGNVLNKIQSKLKSSLKTRNQVDEYDIKDKIKKYKQKYDKMYERYRNFEAYYLRDAKQQLVSNRSKNPYQNDVEMDDLTRLRENKQRMEGIHREAHQVRGIVDNSLGQLNNQGRTLDRIDAQNRLFDHELSITDQLMRILTNRDLITKLILVLLVVFLGLADLVILFLKIT